MLDKLRGPLRGLVRKSDLQIGWVAGTVVS